MREHFDQRQLVIGLLVTRLRGNRLLALSAAVCPMQADFTVVFEIRASCFVVRNLQAKLPGARRGGVRVKNASFFYALTDNQKKWSKA